MFDPAEDLERAGDHALAFHQPGQLLPEAVEADFDVVVVHFQVIVDPLLLVAEDVTEAEVFEKVLEIRNPQAVGDRGVNEQGLFGDAALFGRRQRIQREHVVRAVAQLDDQHADVLDRRQEHFTEGQRGNDEFLVRMRGDQLLVPDQVDLGQAVDEVGNVRAVPRLDRFDRMFRVLHDVVQECGDHHRAVAGNGGDQRRDENGMNDVGFAAFARLARMGFLGKKQRVFDLFVKGDMLMQQRRRTFNIFDGTDQVDIKNVGHGCSLRLEMGDTGADAPERGTSGFGLEALDDHEPFGDLHQCQVGGFGRFQVEVKFALGTVFKLFRTLRDGDRQLIAVDAGHFQCFGGNLFKTHVCHGNSFVVSYCTIEQFV